MSVRYGRFVKAMSPYDDAAAPPARPVSPFQSCQAHQFAVRVLNPSGWVPVGDAMTYCALRLLADVVLPKWPAALTASAASWWPVAWLGDVVDVSSQMPAYAPPVG